MALSWFRRWHTRVTLAPKRNPVRQSFRPRIEALEDRALMTILTPTWIGEGPTTNADISVAGRTAGDGAIQTVAIDPGNANRAFAATIDGGVWKTTNLTAANPHWVPVTDQVANAPRPFLGMTDIAFSPLDNTHNTVYASTGRFSNSYVQGGPPDGVYKTTDGGATWTDLGNATLGGLTITNIIPTGLTSSGNQVVFASTVLIGPLGSSGGAGTDYSAGKTAGVYRSNDGGQTWSLVSGTNGLPAGDAFRMIADPSNINRFYVALPGKGIFITNDGGASWKATAGNSQITGLATTISFRLAVGNYGGTNVLYIAAVNAAGDVSGVYRSTTQGASFTKLDLPGDPIKSVNTGDQGLNNVSLAADPVNPNVVFIGGDRGNLFRGDASLAAGSQWASITGAGANGTAAALRHAVHALRPRRQPDRDRRRRPLAAEHTERPCHPQLGLRRGRPFRHGGFGRRLRLGQSHHLRRCSGQRFADAEYDGWHGLPQSERRRRPNRCGR